MRFSAWRRMRVVRWSRRKRSPSSPGSSARRSMLSSRASCRWTSSWLRRARLTKTLEIPPASSALSAAAPRGVVDGGEGLCHLSDLVLCGRGVRCCAVDVDVLARAEPAHRGGQVAVGDTECGVAQSDEVHDEAAADAHGDDEGGGDSPEAKEHGRTRGRERGGGRGAALAGGGPPGVGLECVEGRVYGGGDGLPGGGGHHCDARAAGGGGHDRVLGGQEPAVGALGGDAAPGGACGFGEVRGGRLEQGATGGGCTDELPQAVGGKTAGHVGGAEHGVLAGQEFACVRDVQCHARVGTVSRAWQRGEGAVDGQSGGDGGGVGVVDAFLREGRTFLRAVAGGVPGGGGPGAQGGQPCGGVHEAAYAVGGLGRQAAGVRGGVAAVEAQPGEGGVGVADALVQCVGAGRSRGRQVALGGAAFGLEGGDGPGHGDADAFGGEVRLAQAGDVLRGGDGGEAPEGQQGHDGHHEQGDDPGAYGAGRLARRCAAMVRRVGGAGLSLLCAGAAWARRPRWAGGSCGAALEVRVARMTGPRSGLGVACGAAGGVTAATGGAARVGGAPAAAGRWSPGAGRWSPGAGARGPGPARRTGGSGRGRRVGPPSGRGRRRPT